MSTHEPTLIVAAIAYVRIISVRNYHLINFISSREHLLTLWQTHNTSSKGKEKGEAIQNQHDQALKGLQEDGSKADEIDEKTGSATKGGIAFESWCFTWTEVFDEHDGKSEDCCSKEKLQILDQTFDR